MFRSSSHSQVDYFNESFISFNPNAILTTVDLPGPSSTYSSLMGRVVSSEKTEEFSGLCEIELCEIEFLSFFFS